MFTELCALSVYIHPIKWIPRCSQFLWLFFYLSLVSLQDYNLLLLFTDKMILCSFDRWLFRCCPPCALMTGVRSSVSVSAASGSIAVGPMTVRYSTWTLCFLMNRLVSLSLVKVGSQAIFTGPCISPFIYAGFLFCHYRATVSMVKSLELRFMQRARS